MSRVARTTYRIDVTDHSIAGPRARRPGRCRWVCRGLFPSVVGAGPHASDDFGRFVGRVSWSSVNPSFADDFPGLHGPWSWPWHVWVTRAADRDRNRVVGPDTRPDD